MVLKIVLNPSEFCYYSNSNMFCFTYCSCPCTGSTVSSVDEEMAKRLRIPNWFYQHYKNELGSLLSCFSGMKCIKCKYESVRKIDITRHYVVHLEKNVPCPQCGIKFPDDTGLNRHRKRKDRCSAFLL
jgi:hypothetical protein